MKKHVLGILVWMLALSLYGQAPQKLSYQAVVRNAEGTLVSNGPVGVRVLILQGGTNGTAVYGETQRPSSNANGLITLAIGTGTGSGNFSEIDWGKGPLSFLLVCLPRMDF